MTHPVFLVYKICVIGCGRDPSGQGLATRDYIGLAS